MVNWSCCCGGGGGGGTGSGSNGGGSSGGGGWCETAWYTEERERQEFGITGGRGLFMSGTARR